MFLAVIGKKWYFCIDVFVLIQTNYGFHFS